MKVHEAVKIMKDLPKELQRAVWDNKDPQLMAITAEFELDVIKLDDFFNNDPEYNGKECTYKGKKNVSMKKYIQLKYGKEASEIIDKLLKV